MMFFHHCLSQKLSPKNKIAVMNILLSNDDGYNAPGIKALVKQLLLEKNCTQLSVLAPDRDRSGASNSLTLDRPLLPIAENVNQLLANGSDQFISKLQHYYSLNGTPTDCVHIALTALLKQPIDIVISGINAGANLGDDVLYSGTVAAATEGRHLGLPALAVSLAFPHQISHEFTYHYDTAAKMVANILLHIKKYPLNEQSILNINVPNVAFEQIKGIQVTRLGRRHKSEPAIEQIDPRGRKVYWLGPVGKHADAGPGTDFYAIENGFVSITPLTIDLTDYAVSDALEKWTVNANLLTTNELINE